MFIRIAKLKDAQAIADIYAPYVEETAISFEIAPPTTDQMTQRISSSLDIYPWLVCEKGERLLGYAYASPFRKRHAYQWITEVSVYVDACAQRSGVGTRLYGALLGLLNIQGFKQALAGMTLPNQASERLHAKLGFKHLADYKDVGFKHNVWHSTRWFRLTLAEPTLNATPPLPFSQLNPQLRESILNPNNGQS